MKKYCLIGLLLTGLACRLWSQEKVVSVYFSSGDAMLSSDAKLRMKALLEELEKNNNNKLIISGFTDLHGDSATNLHLSKKRAMSVSDYFTRNGIEKNRITLEFFGEGRPVAKEKRDLGKNRRVEISLLGPKIPDKKVRPGVYGRVWKKPLKHIYSSSKLSTSENLILDGPGGTKIWIPANALCRPNGEAITAEVEFELTEYYHHSELLLASLHSLGDDGVLEYGGLIKLSARSDGENLMIKKGQSISIEFRVSKTEQGMALYHGTSSGDEIDWRRQQEIKNAVTDRSVLNAGAGSYLGVWKRGTDDLVFASNRMGWIACARLNADENKTSLKVEIDTAYKPVVRLLIKDKHIILPGVQQGKGIYVFRDLPAGQNASLVVFAMLKSIPYFVSKEIIIVEGMVEKLNPKITSFEVVNALVKKLD